MAAAALVATYNGSSIGAHHSSREMQTQKPNQDDNGNGGAILGVGV